jgi:hypothetical protein
MLLVLNIEITVFCYVTPYSLIDRRWCFGGICYLYVQSSILKMKTADSSQHWYISTRLHGVILQKIIMRTWYKISTYELVKQTIHKLSWSFLVSLRHSVLSVLLLTQDLRTKVRFFSCRIIFISSFCSFSLYLPFLFWWNASLNDLTQYVI